VTAYTNTGSPQHAVPAYERRVLWVYVTSILIWGLDFRAATSGAGLAVQLPILLLFGACFLRIVVPGAIRGFNAGALWVLLLAALLFMGDSAVTGLVNDQQPFKIMLNLIPISIYILACVLTYVTLSITREHTPQFLDGLRLACLASGVLHVLVTGLTRGPIDLTTSRYEVLSGAVVPSLGILPVGLTQQLSLMDILVLLINLAIAVVSVTRTLVIALVVQLGAVLIARPSIVFRRSMQKGVAVSLLVALVVVGVDSAAGTGLTARWFGRLTMSQRLGSDPSGLSRIAETHYMWDKFTSSPATVVFGNGLAARTSLYGRENAREELLIGKIARKEAMHSTGIGHENYVGILYVAGLFGGGVLLVVQFLNAVQSVLIIRTLQQRPSVYRAADAHVGIWGGVIVIGMLLLGFLGPLFTDRDECLWLGIGTGMIYWARDMIRSTGAKST
jgi:hypothetical protein